LIRVKKKYCFIERDYKLEIDIVLKAEISDLLKHVIQQMHFPLSIMKQMDIKDIKDFQIVFYALKLTLKIA